ncbi:hypothetical protein pb186bvf_013469 [Paramecium bursaria]
MDGRTIVFDVSPFWSLQTLINCIKNKQVMERQFFLYHIQGSLRVLIPQEKLDALLFNDLNLKNEDFLEIHNYQYNLQNANASVQTYNALTQIAELRIIQYSELQDQSIAPSLTQTIQLEHTNKSFLQSSVSGEGFGKNQQNKTKAYTLGLNIQQQNQQLRKELEKRNLQIINLMEQNIQYKNNEIASLKQQNDELLQNKYNNIQILDQKEIQIQQQQKLLEEQQIKIKNLEEIIQKKTSNFQPQKTKITEQNKSLKKISGPH